MDEILIGEGSTALQPGQQVLLFLKRQTSEDAPGITAYDEFYVTVSLDNGVFDLVDGDWVEPRMSRVFEETRYRLQQVREEASSTQSGSGAIQQFTDARPLPEWRRVEAPGWPSQPGFSLRVPPGWELKELQGIDSYVGEVTGDGVRLTFDYGGFSWSLDPADDPAHTYTVVYEDIGGFEAKLLISMKAGSGYTGVYFANLGGPSLNLVGEGLTPEQQQTAMAVFRSIRISSREALDNLGGEYSVADLAAWYKALSKVIWQVPGIAWTDLDEAKNRIEIGMYPRRGAREKIEAAIATVDVPRGAIVTLVVRALADGLLTTESLRTRRSSAPSTTH